LQQKAKVWAMNHPVTFLPITENIEQDVHTC
jgi:hypothetical protein